MKFLRAFVLALASSTAVAMIIVYVRWMLTLSPKDEWLRNTSPLQFHLHHIWDLTVIPLLVFVIGGCVFIVPAFAAWMLARRFKISPAAVYFPGAAAGAAITSAAIAAWPDWDAPVSFGSAFLSVLMHSLPPCLVGGWVFWRWSRED